MEVETKEIKRNCIYHEKDILGFELDEKDQPFWLPSKLGRFINCAITWCEVRPKRLEISWWKLVLFPYLFKTMLSLNGLSKNRLATWPKILQSSYNGYSWCLIYRGSLESKNHLFLSVLLLKEFGKVMGYHRISSPEFCRDDAVKWGF